MADITTLSSNKKKFFNRRSTRVDLTPMVDLGFILVTFFVFTSTLQQPLAMDILYPKESAISKDEICESCVLTVLPAKHDKIWYYEGSEQTAQYKETSYAELRTLLLRKKQKVIQQRGEDQFVLIIRPLQTSQYQNLVTIMDECAITKVLRYYIDEPSAAELERFGD